MREIYGLLTVGLTVVLVLTCLQPQALAQTQKPSVAEVRDFMAAAQVDKSMKQIMPVILNQIWGILDRRAPGVTTSIKSELRKEAEQIFLDNMNMFSEIIIPVYRKNFSRAEVLAMTKFYKTPEGRSAMSKMGIIFKESAEAGRKVGQVLGLRVYEHMKKRLHEKGYKL